MRSGVPAGSVSRSGGLVESASMADATPQRASSVVQPTPHQALSALCQSIAPLPPGRQPRASARPPGELTIAPGTHRIPRAGPNRRQGACRRQACRHRSRSVDLCAADRPVDRRRGAVLYGEAPASCRRSERAICMPGTAPWGESTHLSLIKASGCTETLKAPESGRRTVVARVIDDPPPSGLG